jgi:hypothetical protein
LMASTQYIGKAGQFAVMAELSFRGYNVAIPEIDVGDDVFVVNQTTGQLSRIQVKTATGRRLTQRRFGDRRVYSCQFLANVEHVNDPIVQGSHYAFAIRCGPSWRFLVFERGILRHLIQQGWGTQTGQGKVLLTATLFTPTEAATSSLQGAVDLSNYAANWDAWPAQ